MMRLVSNLWCALLVLLLSAAAGDGQVINSFSPLFASPGEIVVIQGSGFTGVSAVQFANGRSATFTATSDTQIATTVPSGAVSGPIGVLKSGNLVFSVQSFTAIGPGPYVDSFTPATGNQGVQVTFTGVHFTGVTSVSFNGVAASSIAVTADTQLRATVPAGATSGSITVTSPAGTWTTGTPFYLPPSIANFSPASGTVGTSVTINGANYLNASAVRFNGVSTPFTVNTASRITATVPAGASSGAISVTAPAGGGSSSSSFIVSLPGAVAPTITAHPQPQTASIGQTVTFFVTASGTQPLAYRWRKNGSFISGATSGSYSVANVQASSVGSYDVEVSNVAGTVFSQSASLTVNTPPSISTQPLNKTVFVGQSASFSVSISGSSPLSFQWRKNGTNISGATSQSFFIGGVQASQAGGYSVVVSNPYGSVTSATATLTVSSAVAPSISSQPQSRQVDAGQSVTFSVSATGSPSPSFQWRKNGTAIPGETGTSYTIGSVQQSHAGTYDVVASNIAGTEASSPALLTVGNAPLITVQPTNQTVTAGATVTLSFAASGTAPLSYQWRREGTNIAGANSGTLVLNSAQPGDSGYYSVFVTNSLGTAVSSAAAISILPPGGLPNRVLNLDGDGDFVVIQDGPGLQNPTALTIEGWFFPVANAPNTKPHFINKGDGQDGASSRSYELSWTPADGFWAEVFLGTDTYATLKTPTPPGQWTHIAITYDSANRLICLYKNGTLAVSSTNDAAGVPLTGQTVRQTTLPLVFGVIPGGPPTHATGSMDEVRIWSRVRTADEIAGSMFCRLVGTEPGLAGYWTFDDGTASDLAGHGHHGAFSGNAAPVTLLGADPLHSTNQTPCITSQPQNLMVGIGQTASFAVTAVAGTNTGPFSYQWRKDGTHVTGATNATLVLSADQSGESGFYSVVVSNQFGTATSATAAVTVVNRVLTLDGSGDFVTITSAADLQDPTAFTIEGWFYPVANAANTNPHFINKGDGQSGDSSRSYEVEWNPTSGFGATVFLGTSTYATLSTPGPAGEWTHIALTYDSKQKLLCLYKNGVLVASDTNNAAGVPLTGQTVRQTTLPLVFGVIPGGPPTHATGSMDEVRIWSRVRTAEEIAGSMFCRLAGSEPGLAGYWTFDDGTARDATGHGHDGVFSGNASATVLLGSDPLHSTNKAPCITTQTHPQTAITGSSVSWLVTAVGEPPLTFQWQRNGLSLAGATNSSLTLTNLARQPDAGTYSVSVSNALGTITSVSAVLKVLVSQRMEEPERLPDGRFRLLFGDFDSNPLTDAEKGRFQVQWSTNLSSWQDFTNTLGAMSNGKVTFEDPLPSSSLRRFYRVITK